MARGGGVLVFFILYVILGLYLINIGINFIDVPQFLLSIEKWVLFVGGILLIFGGINFLRVNRYTAIRHR